MELCRGTSVNIVRQRLVRWNGFLLKLSGEPMSVIGVGYKILVPVCDDEMCKPVRKSSKRSSQPPILIKRKCPVSGSQQRSGRIGPSSRDTTGGGLFSFGLCMQEQSSEGETERLTGRKGAAGRAARSRPNWVAPP